MPNRSLEDHLFNRVLNPLPWITRLQIMLGAAQARIGLSTRGTGSPGDISRFQILQRALG
ncbi:hypothetical protein RchiOBHm_Chr0c22g0500541 [Rosa chinensis]|uniref:Uncharacterized protein n=1 Tax=Rosa chinensis TaxID=74649 RepID=A0A2P6SQG6_ROSCH|nr:hypothetical protein RchiOBHm_Chr0c22g0500541 [Rosa chinensis]